MTVSAQKQPSRREAQSKSVEDLLLHPKNLEYAKKLRAGKTLPPYPTKTTLTLNSTLQLASEIQNHLVAWLKTGDIEQLARLLKDIPQALALPEVWEQVFYLSRLRCLASEEDCDLWGGVAAAPDQETLLPRGVKPAAKDALARLLRAWVQSILPGYTVERIKYPKRRGAPRKTSEQDALELLSEVETLLEKMDKRPAMCFKQRKDETREDLIERTARLVQELYSDSWWSLVSYSLPDDPEVDASGKPIFAGRLRRKPLPIDTARSIAQKAVKKRSVSKNNLLYGLLARFYYNQHVTPNQVRGMVERAEADWPEFAPPRRSRKR